MKPSEQEQYECTSDVIPTILRDYERDNLELNLINKLSYDED
jgi:hypothetical protein